MWLPSMLLLLSLPGCFSIQGPALVRGQELGSLTVQCSYNRGWETYKKWWCRGAKWDYCQILVQTRGSQESVQRNRVSIRDDHRERLVTVTMEDLRRDDQDTYWCGISRPGTDRGAPVKVIIDAEGVAPSSLEKLLPRTPGNNHREVSSGPYVRNHYLLLVYVKVPILLIVVGAILWLKGPQRGPEDQWEQPIYTNLSPDLTRDTAP